MHHACTMSAQKEKEKKEKERKCLFKLTPLVRDSMHIKQLLIVINKSDL